MLKRIVIALVCCLVVVAGANAALDREDNRSGVILSDGPTVDPFGGGITCTLSVSPDPATNSDVVTWEISCSPIIAGDWDERVTFRWATAGAPDFFEWSIRMKRFRNHTGTTGSFEAAVVPTATYITGTAVVNAIVKDGLGHLVCTASTTLTVS